MWAAGGSELGLLSANRIGASLTVSSSSLHTRAAAVSVRRVERSDPDAPRGQGPVQAARGFTLVVGLRAKVPVAPGGAEIASTVRCADCHPIDVVMQHEGKPGCWEA